MAKRKTRKEKILLARKQRLGVYSIPEYNAPVSREVAYGYDASLLGVDLRKTLLIGGFILLLEVLIYWQLR